MRRSMWFVGVLVAVVLGGCMSAPVRLEATRVEATKTGELTAVAVVAVQETADYLGLADAVVPVAKEKADAAVVAVMAADAQAMVTVEVASKSQADVASVAGTVASVAKVGAAVAGAMPGPVGPAVGAVLGMVALAAAGVARLFGKKSGGPSGGTV